MTATIQPYALTRDDGQARWVPGFLATIKASGAQTGGAFALVEELLSPAYETPLHIHHAEDEALYVLEGELTAICGDHTWQVGAGDYAFLPRGVPHGFRLTSPDPGRVLVLTMPAGFDQFIVDAGEPAPARTLPPAGPPDLDHLMAAAARHQIELLGPLPA